MQINILGYGLMGKQIAALLYLGGFQINIWSRSEVNPNDLDRQLKILKRRMNLSRTNGVVKYYTEIDKLPDAITIESVVEDLEIKRGIYHNFVNSESPYFTNSSSLSPNEIDPHVNALHFFNPLSLRLIELCVTSEKVIESIHRLLSYLEGIGFEIIRANMNRGYIGNYILFSEISSVFKLIEIYGYSIDHVKNMYAKLYNGRDIFMIIDLIGVDTANKILVNLNETDKSIYLPGYLEKAVKGNILGKKNKTSIVKFINELR